MTFRLNPRGDVSEAVSVWPWANGDGCVLAVQDPVAVQAGHLLSHAVIPAPEVPDAARGIATAMHEAAGLPVPVILTRPGPRGLLVPGGGDGKSWVGVERSPYSGHMTGGHGRGTITAPGEPGVLLSIVTGSAIRLIGDEPLRVALALVDKMEPDGPVPEPDPADVAELAAEIRDELERSMTSPQPGQPEIAARTALRWIKQQEAGS